MISISYKLMLTGKVSTKGAFSLSGNVLCSTVGKNARQYTGEYTVIPRTYEQSLKTAGYALSENVTVERIPYSTVSNPQGGYTINIGG